ncbi:MAG: hypothetical protein KDE15_02675 [Erythrobacter sp.]|nr:hypothetical protein [Erythrobacter sp.]
MLRLLLIAVGALALGLSATPALAQDKGLRCMAASYTPAQRQQMAELGPRARFADASGPNAAADALSDVAMDAVVHCITESGWGEDAAMFATFYELGRVNEAAFRQSGELSSEDLRRLDTALARGDRTALWDAIERGVWAGVADSDVGASDADAMVLGTFMLESGLGLNEQTANRVGVLLGFMGLQRVGQREFRALQ